MNDAEELKQINKMVDYEENKIVYNNECTERKKSINTEK